MKGKNTAPQSDTVLIEAPVASPRPESYTSRHVEIGALSNEQATALRHIFDGLQREKAQLKSGRFVQTSADAIRYLLEQAWEVLPR